VPSPADPREARDARDAREAGAARYDVRYPRGRPAAGYRGRVRAALVPASWLYRVGADTVARVRSAGARPDTERRARVVSVGNLEAGGNGKTPLCRHLLRSLGARGTAAACVSRGYGSRAARYRGVTVVADAFAPGPGERWVRRDHPALAAEVGDEGAMVAATVPQVPLVFGPDKARALDVACRLVGDGVVVLDDGFQSWGVPRDVDVVLLDARRPFGDGWLLPAGTLREEPDALERADVILFNGVEGEEDVDRAREEVARRTGIVKPCAGIRRTIALDGEVAGPVVSVCALARPERFEAMLVAAGCRVSLALRYPDHHAYTAGDVEAIRRAVAERGGAVLVTTEKDRVKLDVGECVVARLEIALTDESVLWKHVEPRK